MELDGFERFNLARNKQKTYSCFLFGGKTSHRLNDNDTDRLQNALKILIRNRHLLRVNVFNGKISEIEVDANGCLELIETDGDICSGLTRIHERFFETDVELPLWKLFVVDSQWIVFACDHLLLDGTSAALVVEELLLLMKEENSGVIAKDCDFRKELKELTSPSYANAMGAVAYYLLPSFVKSYLEKWTLPTMGKSLWGVDENRGTSIEERLKSTGSLQKLIKLDFEQYANLQTQLRRHSVSFTSFLVYLNITFFSTSKFYPSIAVPVNLRRFIEDSNRAYGLFVAVIVFQYWKQRSGSRAIDWGLIQHLDEEFSDHKIRSASKKMGQLNMVDAEKYLQTMTDRPRSTVGISNMGLRPSGYDEHIFSQPTSAEGPYFTMSLASTRKTVSIMLTAVPVVGKDVFATYSEFIEREMKIDSV